MGAGGHEYGILHGLSRLKGKPSASGKGAKFTSQVV